MHDIDAVDTIDEREAVKPERPEAHGPESALAEEAANWLRCLDIHEAGAQAGFGKWIRQSPAHVEEFLLATAIDRQLRIMGESRLREAMERASAPEGSTEHTLYAATAAGDEQRQEQLYFRYRRPLLQIFLQRQIPRAVAHDLIQRIFSQAIERIRTGDLKDPNMLRVYLYKTACSLATAYCSGELARQPFREVEPAASLSNDARSLEERADSEVLRKCVRLLLAHLPMARDRQVLVSYLVDEEPKEAICRKLRLTDLQFKEAMWRARHRFGEILKKYGVSVTS